MKILALLATGIVLILSLNSNNHKEVNKPVYYPEYILEWTEINTLIEKGLVEDALKKVETLWNKAIKEANHPQIYKTLIHLEKLLSQKDESGYKGIITRIETRLPLIPEPSKSLTYSVLGSLYLNLSSPGYFYRNQRTNIEGAEQDSADLNTWSPEKIIIVANSYIQKSLAYEGLKTSLIEDYKPILVEEAHLELCPSLYELLLHRAIDHYNNHSSSLTDFEESISDDILFSELDKFIKSDVNKHPVMELYQKWLTHLVAIKKEKALTLANLNRLQYSISISRNPDKYKNYGNALNTYFEENKKFPTSGLILQHLISYKLSHNHEDQNQYITIDSLCNYGIENYKDSLFLNYYNFIKQEIRKVSLHCISESATPAKEYSKILVKFRNIDEVLFKIYKIPFSGIKDIQREEEIKNLKSLEKHKILKSWVENWKTPADFMEHSIEIKIDPLDVGKYLIVAMRNQKSSDQIGLAYSYFFVTNLSSFQYQNPSESKVFVVDRKSGQAIKDAQVSFFKHKYHRYDQAQELEVIATKKTNAEGFVSCPKSPEYLQYLITKSKDQYYDNAGINHYYNENEHSYTVNHFFTDRSLYRPGQTVYFKFLSVTNNSNGSYPKLNTNKQFLVRLRNANYQEVGQIKVKTNEFGSSSGSFILPKSGLTGNFQIETEYGGASIQVDEYKRPNFEVKFDSIKQTYKLGDQVKIAGKALTYNGIPVESAKVKYRIKRESFQFPWYRRWMFIPHTGEELITSGTTTTNSDGEFTIDFKAEKKLNSEINSFTFSIEVDITDLNQETQTGTNTITLSDKKLFINYNSKEIVNLDLDSLVIKSVNIAGNPVEAKLKLSIYALKSPDKNLRERFWPSPDIQKYTESEFKKYFPYDVYKNEDKAENFPVLKKVFEKEISNSSLWILKNSELKLKSGSYKIEISASDKNNNLDTIIAYSSMLESKSSFKYFKPAILPSPESLEPGANLNITHLANFESYKVYYFLESFKNKKSAWLSVNKANMLSYKIAEEDRGGMAYGGICILNNRYYRFNQQTEIPWSNKQLNIESVSFRDKLLPGQEETWTFKLKDKFNTKEKYEMLASLYDQSLDQILPHSWNLGIMPQFYNRSSLNSSSIHISNWHPFDHTNIYNGYSGVNYIFPELNIWELLNRLGHLYATSAGTTMDAVMTQAPPRMKSSRKEDERVQEEPNANDGAGRIIANEVSQEEKREKLQATNDNIPIRKNLNETVFFYPHLYTDNEGNVVIKFTMNEAMTKWKLQMMAHSMDLKYGTKTLEVLTRKPIQIKPFYPRFFRQSDQIQLSATISNLSDELQKGNAQLTILDATTLIDITKDFIVSDIQQKFSIGIDKSLALNWKIKIPETETRTLLLRYVAIGDKHTDGEENIIPVVTNSKLVTETLPLPIKGGQTKSFNFESLSKLGSNGSKPHQFTLEFSSHPVWYAVQALPYIMEYPHECSEQIMSRIYANSLGVDIMKKYPKVASTLKKISAEGEPKSKLLLNQELKSALIEETPWVMAAESETEQMKRVALLMDFNNMNASLQSSVQKLQQRQNSDGSFSWFPGSWPDRYMTQHIVIKIAHLKRLGISGEHMDILQSIGNRARGFLDYMIKKDYNEIASRVKEGKDNWENNHLGSTELHYYYCKSLYSDWNSDKEMQSIDNYYLNQMENFWIQRDIYDQGLCAIVASKKDKNKLASLIANSLKQRSLNHDELGRYWKNSWSYYWYQLPVETQALMIEVFYDISKDYLAVDELKTWLMKNKQTQHWGTTKATTEAIYALLAFGENYVEESQSVEINLSSLKLDLTKSSTGIGYYKNSWNKSEIKSDYSKITVKNPNKSIAWGAAYYQYFQNLDKIEKSTMRELILNKELYLRDNTGKKELLKPITDLSKIKTGDKVTARIIIKCDRPMDYVHLKVMRAAGLEPIQQLSGYHYSNGLGYYLSPRDLATDFFISYLPKGTFVLEYDLRASFKGEFSDGVTTLQSMYAPEFSAHSKGIRVSIEN